MNRLVRPVMFAFEPDVVSVFGQVSFGSAGAPTLSQANSKGLCNITRQAVSITGTTTSSSDSVTSVSSFLGLYIGMGISGTGIQAGSTIIAMNAGAGTLQLSAAATASGSVTLTVAGGQYLIQFGQQAGVRLDTYNKLLWAKHLWDLTGLPGAASTQASTPAAPDMFLITNNISVLTVPPTVASALTSATLTVQFGTWSAGTFGAKDPASGEIVRLSFKFSRSSAI